MDDDRTHEYIQKLESYSKGVEKDRQRALEAEYMKMPPARTARDKRIQDTLESIPALHRAKREEMKPIWKHRKINPATQSVEFCIMDCTPAEYGATIDTPDYEPHCLFLNGAAAEVYWIVARVGLNTRLRKRSGQKPRDPWTVQIMVTL